MQLRVTDRSSDEVCAHDAESASVERLSVHGDLTGADSTQNLAAILPRAAALPCGHGLADLRPLGGARYECARCVEMEIAARENALSERARARARDLRQQREAQDRRAQARVGTWRGAAVPTNIIHQAHFVVRAETPPAPSSLTVYTMACGARVFGTKSVWYRCAHRPHCPRCAEAMGHR